MPNLGGGEPPRGRGAGVCRGRGDGRGGGTRVPELRGGSGAARAGIPTRVSAILVKWSWFLFPGFFLSPSLPSPSFPLSILSYATDELGVNRGSGRGFTLYLCRGDRDLSTRFEFSSIFFG